MYLTHLIFFAAHVAYLVLILITLAFIELIKCTYWSSTGAIQTCIGSIIASHICWFGFRGRTASTLAIKG